MSRIGSIRANASKKHELVAKIVDQSWVVDDRLDIRECLVKPSGFDRPAWRASSALRYRSGSSMRIFPSSASASSGSPALRMALARSARSIELLGIDLGDALSLPGPAARSPRLAEVKWGWKRRVPRGR